ncbi:hypothetical protein C8J57DRAFT_1245982 [Mycena rebaudengoi]|nr:hypothetical protein C8J57DRAFT_1245982 [Mycena rebaudengoi]
MQWSSIGIWFGRWRGWIIQLLLNLLLNGSDENISMDLNTFCEKFVSNGGVDRNQLSFSATSRTNPCDQIFVYFSLVKSTGVKTMRQFNRIKDCSVSRKKKGIERAIIVFPHTMTAPAKNVITALAPQYSLEAFSDLLS